MLKLINRFYSEWNQNKQSSNCIVVPKITATKLLVKRHWWQDTGVSCHFNIMINVYRNIYIYQTKYVAFAYSLTLSLPPHRTEKYSKHALLFSNQNLFIRETYMNIGNISMIWSSNSSLINPFYRLNSVTNPPFWFYRLQLV